MRKPTWLAEMTAAKILADGVSNVIWALAGFAGIAMFGVLRAAKVSWWWAFVTAVGVVGAVCSWFVLRRRLHESPPGSVTARIHQLANSHFGVKTQEDAKEWVRTAYDGIRGLGLALEAAVFSDLYSVIVLKETNRETALSTARQAATWLHSLAARLSASPHTTNTFGIAAFQWVFEKALKSAIQVSTKKEALAFWDAFVDKLYSINLRHLLNEFHPAMKSIRVKLNDEDNVEQEMKRVIELLEMYVKIIELTGNRESGALGDPKKSGDQLRVAQTVGRE